MTDVKEKMCVIKNSLGQSHIMVRGVVSLGDAAIDATAGNGNDTALLAELVGEGGRVYSFDIQLLAMDRTKKRLEGLGLAERVKFINDGHENMGLYVKEKVKAVMFNLGYLPRGDHNIGTKAPTTIAAIEQALKLIDVHGIISVVVYYGGDSGFEEKETLLEYIKTIDNKQYTVMKTEFVNQINCPPIFVCIERLF